MALVGVAFFTWNGTVVVSSRAAATRAPAVKASRIVFSPLTDLRIAAARAAKPKARAHSLKAHAVRRPRRRSRPVLVRPSTTPSFYERTTSTPALRAQGCRAGRARTDGLVVLDFGKLAYRAVLGGYGVLTFGNRFAHNREITVAMKAFARGYSQCLPRGSRARITLARGTSNYNQVLPSSYAAGRLWAAGTSALGTYLGQHHFDHVTAAAADDVEPAWDRGFTRTYNFLRGYAKADRGYLLYNFGSLDGGVGAIWRLRQAYYVAGGMNDVRAVPEIYNRTMAGEWAELLRLSSLRYGKPIQLAGLMTQHWTDCSGCGYTAPQAHRALVHELAKVATATGKAAIGRLAAVTNIGAPDQRGLASARR